MKTASIKEIKSALESLEKEELIAVCQRLAKFKKENKELITYLLYESVDERSYVNAVKDIIDENVSQINTSSLFFVKKTLRKIIRTTGKFIRYSDVPTTEVELWMHVCQSFTQLGIDWQKSQVITNMYTGLNKKIDKAIGGLHEDLQYDYRRQWERL